MDRRCSFRPARSRSFFRQDTKSCLPRVLGDVLDAFLAVYELRSDQRASKRDEYYLGNLPGECRPGKAKTSDDGVTPDIVRRTVAETRKRLSEVATKLEPLLAGRNLLALLEDEKLSGADAVDRALRPFWPGLWRLAARGHYCLTQEPLRIKPAQQESFYQPPIAPIREGEYTLSFARGEGNDFSLLLSFPGPRGPMYPFSGYPRITEFRACWGRLRRTARLPVGMASTSLAMSRSRKTKREGQRFLVSCSGQRDHVRLLREGVEVRPGAVSPRLGSPEVRMAWDGWRSNTVSYEERCLRTGSWTDTSPRIGCCTATKVAVRELAANAAACDFPLTVAPRSNLWFPYGNWLILLGVKSRRFTCFNQN